MSTTNITVNIYGSSARSETFLYLREDLSEEDLEPALQALLGPLRHVMLLELTPQRTLVQADVIQVIAQVADKGYYLQAPPQDPPRDPKQVPL